VKLLAEQKNLEFLSNQFENIKFLFFRSDGHLSFISCIACICETSNEIVKNWRAIQNLVAVYNQNSGNFDAWNIYIAFISIEKIPTWEKYEIENNKFSARKIVLDEFQESPSIEYLTNELENQLLGTDLTLETRPKQLKEHSTYLEKYYRGAPLDSKSESKDMRAQMINTLIESLNHNEN